MTDSPHPIPQTLSTILDLSLEIRLIIYEYFFRGVVLRSEYHHDNLTKTDCRILPGGPANETVTVSLQQGTFRRYDRTTPNERRENFMALLSVSRLIRQEALETMYHHVFVGLPGHKPLTHHLAHKSLMRNIRTLELAMSPTDNLTLDFRRLPKLETLLLDFRGRVRSDDIYYSLPHSYPYSPFPDCPSLREYRHGPPVWKAVVEAMRKLTERKGSRKVRILCYFDSGYKGTGFDAWINTNFYDARTGLDTGAVKYEYEEDFYQ